MSVVTAVWGWGEHLTELHVTFAAEPLRDKWGTEETKGEKQRIWKERYKKLNNTLACQDKIISKDGEQGQVWLDYKRREKYNDWESHLLIFMLICVTLSLSPPKQSLVWLTAGQLWLIVAAPVLQLTDGHRDRLRCNLKTDSPCLCVLPQPFYSAVSHRQHGWRYQLYPA